MDDIDRQRIEALAKANHIRTAKMNMRLDCKAGRRLVSEIIATDPMECRCARLAALIAWSPGIGTTKAANICRAMRVSPNRQMRNLHPLERKRLATRIEAYEKERGERRERRILAAA